MKPVVDDPTSLAPHRLANYLTPLKAKLDSAHLTQIDWSEQVRDVKSRRGAFKNVIPVDKDTSKSLSPESIEYKYLFPVAELLKQINQNQKCLVRVGDAYNPLQVPTLVKARLIADPGLCVTAPLNHRRHFGLMRPTLEVDIPWHKKKNKLLWRGAATGPLRGIPERNFQSRAYIVDVARRKKETSLINVGFTKLLNNPISSLNEVKELHVRHMSIKEQLQYKYLLSLEGNDVASGLKWMMISNSCVLMPVPAIESWFCESLLKPWEHFIPVDPNLGDLEEKLEFCIKNEDVAMAVAQQGKDFAMQFINQQVERELFCSVMTWYCERAFVSNFL